MSQIPTITSKDIGQLMRQERRRNGMTQGELAQTLGVSQSSISKFENGQLIPSAIEWLTFCNLFKLPMRWAPAHASNNSSSLSSANSEPLQTI